MELPLTYSFADLEEILPPGLYRLDLVDAAGNDLDVTVPVNLAANRTADVASVEEAEAAFTMPSGGVSDVRLVLEANVRAMQLQFQHHERTLATSLRMAETLRDGVTTLAESQADCFKSLVATRGFMRNASGAFASAPQLALPTNQNESDDDDDDEQDDDEPNVEAPAPPAMDPMWAAVTAILTPVVAKIVDNMFATRAGSAAVAPHGESKARPPFNIGALFDWRKASPKLIDADVTAEAPISATEVMKMVPPVLLSRLMEVSAALMPDERDKLMPLLQSIPRAGFPGLIKELEPMSTDELTAQLRLALTAAA
jgi:hypothetical protein